MRNQFKMLANKYVKSLSPKQVGKFPEEPIFEDVTELTNTNKVLAFSTPTTYGPANMPLSQLVNRDAFLNEKIDALPATQEEVNERLVVNKYVSPATLPKPRGILRGTQCNYTFPASTLEGTGWYPMDGALYPIASPVGQFLNNCTEAYKTAWHLEIVGDKIRIHDVLTTPDDNNGGYYTRPMSDGMQGQKFVDTLQAHRHQLAVAGAAGTQASFYGSGNTINPFNDSRIQQPSTLPGFSDVRYGKETTPCFVGVLPIIFLGV